MEARDSTAALYKLCRRTRVLYLFIVKSQDLGNVLKFSFKSLTVISGNG